MVINMANLQQLITNRKEIVQQHFNLTYQVKYLTENIFCLTILGDNNHPEYGYMTITKQINKLKELTTQLSPLVKENLEINQEILKEMIKESKEPTILEFLKTILELSDRILGLNDIIDVLISTNIHELNVGNSRKTGFALFFSYYSEKYAEKEHTLNVTVTDNIITKIKFR